VGKPKTYTVLLLADQHCGNEMGLLHPQVKGFTFGNSWQEYAWECWKHMKSKLPKRIDVTVSMDECLDGPADKNKKYRTQITKPSKQRECARKLLQPIRAKSDKFFMIAGSNWHVDNLGESTRVLAEELEADNWPNGEPIGYNLLLEFGNVVLDLAHSQSVVMVNRAMPAEREMRYRLADDPFRGEARQIMFIARAHAHNFNLAWDRHGISMTCPGWQGPYYDYGGAKKSLARSVHDMGWVLLNITPGADWPVMPYPTLYEQPKAETIKIA
jgi:hypothetical protein